MDKHGAFYSIEPHGDAWVLYAGRDSEHHGANLCRLSEFDMHGDQTRETIVNALNSGPAPDATALRNATEDALSSLRELINYHDDSGAVNIDSAISRAKQHRDKLSALLRFEPRGTCNTCADRGPQRNCDICTYGSHYKAEPRGEEPR